MGFHMALAIPRRKIGGYEEYVIEWVDEVPRRPLLVNEGVKIVYKGRRDNTEYFEAKPLQDLTPGHCPRSERYLFVFTVLRSLA